MNKRLREKLGKEGRLTENISFLKNSSVFFCGEKRIVELYCALSAIDSNHELLTFGSVLNGRFRFGSDYTRRAPEHLRNKPVVAGVPLSPQHALHYIEELTGAVTGFSQN